MDSSRGAADPLPCVAPLLPDRPPRLHQPGTAPPATLYASPRCPPAMRRQDWRVKDYTLTKTLYRGKASTLFAAVCKASGVQVVLKSYAKRRLSTLNWYQVERELRLHSALQHENIIQLYGAFEDDEAVYFVQELAGGGDLYEELKRSGGTMPETRVAGAVMRPFLSAMAYLHKQGIIHRDIKPENILLTAGRQLRLADFGLSIDWREERPVTRAGTLDYMSPEVLACPEKSRPEENKEKVLLGYSNAVDVWAAGVLAYELLVGRPPFERESRDETCAHIKTADPVYPPWMSDGARDFIGQALSKSARKRPTMADLQRHPWIVCQGKQPAATPFAAAAAAAATPPASTLLSQSLPAIAPAVVAPAASAQMTQSSAKQRPTTPFVPAFLPGQQRQSVSAAAAESLPGLPASPLLPSASATNAGGSGLFFSAASLASRGSASYATAASALPSACQSPTSSFTMPTGHQQGTLVDILTSSGSPSPRTARQPSRPPTAGALGVLPVLPPNTSQQQQAAQVPRAASLHSLSSSSQLMPPLSTESGSRRSGQQSHAGAALHTIAEQQSSVAEDALLPPALAATAAAGKPAGKQGGASQLDEPAADAIRAHYGAAEPEAASGAAGASLLPPAGAHPPTLGATDVEQQTSSSSIGRAAGLLLSKLKGLGWSKPTPLPPAAKSRSAAARGAAAAPGADAPRAAGSKFSPSRSNSLARPRAAGAPPSPSRTNSTSRPRNVPHTSSFSLRAAVLPPVAQPVLLPLEQPATSSMQQEQQQQQPVAQAAAPAREASHTKLARGTTGPALEAGMRTRPPGVGSPVLRSKAPGLPPSPAAASPSSPRVRTALLAAALDDEEPQVQPSAGSGRGGRSPRLARPALAGKAPAAGGSRQAGSPARAVHTADAASSSQHSAVAPLLRSPSFSKVAARVDTGMRAGRRAGASVKAPSSPGTTLRPAGSRAHATADGVQRSAKSWSSAASSGRVGSSPGKKAAGERAAHQHAVPRRLAMYTVSLKLGAHGRPASPGKDQQNQQD